MLCCVAINGLIYPVGLFTNTDDLSFVMFRCLIKRKKGAKLKSDWIRNVPDLLPTILDLKIVQLCSYSIVGNKTVDVMSFTDCFSLLQACTKTYLRVTRGLPEEGFQGEVIKVGFILRTFADVNVERKRYAYDVNLTWVESFDCSSTSKRRQNDVIRTAFTFYVRVTKGLKWLDTRDVRCDPLSFLTTRDIALRCHNWVHFTHSL